MSEDRDIRDRSLISELSGDTKTRARAAAAELLLRLRGSKGDDGAVIGSQRVFEPESLIADRYRVVRFVAQGGAGQVYEVEDRELGGRVALKVLHPEFASDTARLNQFRQEILLARQVTHANVCRLFDLGHHFDGEVEWLFVTMEWIDGQTLSQYLRSLGPLSEAETVEIMRQVVKGVAVAHEQGVIHRDLKGSNIMLTREQNGESRVVVMDFGLAHRSHQTPAQDDSDRYVVAGTPLYMAPEQKEGQPAGPQADVYALGVLCYHLLSGQWPRQSGSSGSGKSNSGPDGLDVAGGPSVSRELAALLARCLAARHQDRYADAGTLLRALDRCRPRTAIKSWSLKFWAVAGVLAMLVGAGLWLGLRDSQEVPSLFLADLVPADAASEPWVGAAVTQGLESYLLSAESVRVARTSQAMDGETIQALLLESDQQSKQNLADALGTRWLLQGSYTTPREGDQLIRLDLQLVALDSDLAPLKFTVEGLKTGLWDLSSRISGDLLARFGVPGPNAQQAAAAAAEQPQNSQARRLLAEADVALKRWDASVAVGLLETAVELAPENPLIHVALAQAWGLLDHNRNHKASAQRAYELSSGLSRQRQLEIEATHRMAQSQWERAQALYRALAAFYPDELEYGLSLARALDKGSQYEEALATLASLRELPPPMGTDLRIELTEAWVHYHSGDWTTAFASSQAVAGQARRGNARSLLADALLMQVMTSSAVDVLPGEVDAWLSEADQLFEVLGNNRGRARVQQNRGGQAFRAGRYQEAESHYRQGVALARASGNLATVAKGETSLAIVFDVKGRLADGLALKMQVLENYRSRNVRQGQGITLENIGISLWKLGRLDEAMSYFKQAEAEMREMGDETGLALAPYYQGRVWYGLGKLQVAEARFRQAALEAEKRPQGSLGPYIQFEQARLAIAAGRFEAAQATLAQLLKLFQESGQVIDEGDTELLLAKLALAQGRWESAAKHAQSALKIFEPEAVRYYEVGARLLWVASLLRNPAADQESAQAQCDRLGSEAVDLEHRDVALRAQVVLDECAIRLQGASGTESLQQVIERAQKLGLFEAAFEAKRMQVFALSAAGEQTRAAGMSLALSEWAADAGWYLQMLDDLPQLSGSNLRGQ